MSAGRLSPRPTDPAARAAGRGTRPRDRATWTGPHAAGLPAAGRPQGSTCGCRRSCLSKALPRNGKTTRRWFSRPKQGKPNDATEGSSTYFIRGLIFGLLARRLRPLECRLDAMGFAPCTSSVRLDWMHLNHSGVSGYTGGSQISVDHTFKTIRLAGAPCHRDSYEALPAGAGHRSLPQTFIGNEKTHGAFFRHG